MNAATYLGSNGTSANCTRNNNAGGRRSVRLSRKISALVAATTAVLLLGGAAAVSAETAADAGTGSLKLGETAHLGHFDVTVSGVMANRSQSGTNYLAGAVAQVCVTKVKAGTKTVRVSRDPWAITTTKATYAYKAPTNEHSSLILLAGELPVEAYPYQKQVAKGGCVSGLVPVMVSSKGTLKSVQYKNSYGETASWDLR